MVNHLRVWDRLRTLQDDFNRRDFQFITAFADALTVHQSIKIPGRLVDGRDIPADDIVEMINDNSHNSVVRTIARQYGIDNPKDILSRAMNLVGVNVGLQPTPHYSDSLKSTIGQRNMNISESAMRRVVHDTLFREEFTPLDPQVTSADGMYTFAIKIQYSTPETETPRTEHLSVRAGSAEAAKTMAAKIAAEKNYTNVSIVDVELVNYTGPNAGGLVPVTAPVNVQPGAVAGQVQPSDVSPALPNTGVLTPRSGVSGGNLTGGV